MLRNLFVIFGIIVLLCAMNYLIIPNAAHSDRYLVRNVTDKKGAANMLAQIYNNLRKLVFYCDYKIAKAKIHDSKTDDDKYVLEFEKYMVNINNKIDYVTIKESTADSEFTSYSINKGEELVFCLRSKKNGELHVINNLMYVAIHELAHIGCTEVGHTPLFNKIFQFLLKQAIECNVYRYEDYESHPIEYCGMTLNSNILR
ncbi:MAG: protein of unknown function DUF45 [Faunusvirus sp.]|jgi:hypothetical protein|uniref:WLM domain-containing protein n=1 Tax=Faunusvirus sp. TaxID=2487766 RepID=A0A3G4ZW52_9VIRU|nr:MAG: protein of unknown function DUF45 [Faunusvirus sp.]